MSKKVTKKSTQEKGKLSLSTLGVGAIIVLLLGAAIFFINSGTNRPDWVSYSIELSSEQESEVNQALVDWDNLFHCATHINITDEVLTEIPFNSDLEVVALADQGKIYFDLSKMDQPNELRFTILHEATHACKNPPVYLDVPIIYSGGQILGFSGWQLIVRLHDGSITRFTKCEEGIAEWAAEMVDGSYGSSEPGYNSLSKYMFDLFGTDVSVMELVKNNDFQGLAARVTGTPRSMVGVGEIQITMDMCQSYYDQGWPAGGQ